MLGLVAHGLHLLLVVLGLAGVAALLLPQARESFARPQAFRTRAYRPPSTRAEHEQRVAALRTAVRTGRLTAPPALTSATNSTITPSGTGLWPLAAPGSHGERDSSPWRGVAVCGSAAAAFVHAAMLPHHLGEGVLLGAFFLLSAVAQAVWACLVVRSATTELLVLGLLGNLACIALWAVTRTVGLPFGLVPGPEGVGAWDVACVVWEWSVVLACTAGLHTVAARRRLPLGGLGRGAWTWVTLSCVVLAVLSFAVDHR